MRLAFLGFGLVAGSIARAVRANSLADAWAMTAWSPSGDGPRRAAADGVIDGAAATPTAALAGADLVVLAASATACLGLIDSLAGPWRKALPSDAVVTDVASTKGSIVDRADAAGLRFVGGHPMAGLETSGYDAADGRLFVDRAWVIVAGAHAAPTDAGRVADLAGMCGARVVLMDAAAHDRAVAGISHLPLVVAASLAEAVAGQPGDDWAAAAELAAGGWRDTTRVAGGDPAMGAAIVATNAPALAARLRDLRAVLDGWLEELERPDGPDEEAALERLAAARAALDRSP
jgi:prephenate dehydrogenase